MTETTSLPRKIERKEVIYQDKYQQLYRVVAEFDGFTKEYAVSERGQRAALLVVRDGAVLLARQYRLVVNCVALEIPGGQIEEGEEPAAAAARECLEETGVLCPEPKLLVCYHPSLDILSNYTHIFYAEQCEDTGTGDPQRRVWLPLAQCLDMVFCQQITDVLTMVALLAYQTLGDRR